MSSVDVQAFYVVELTSAAFFLRMYQAVDLAAPNVPAISLMDLFLILKPNCFHLYGEILSPYDVGSQQSFQMQMAHLESTPDLLSA